MFHHFLHLLEICFIYHSQNDWLCQFDCSPKSSCDPQPLDQCSLPWPLPFSHLSLSQSLSGSSDLRNWKFFLFLLQPVLWCMRVWSIMPWLFETPWTVARQACLSTGFPRQEYQSGYLPFPSPGDPRDWIPPWWLPLIEEQGCPFPVSELECFRPGLPPSSAGNKTLLIEKHVLLQIIPVWPTYSHLIHVSHRQSM